MSDDFDENGNPSSSLGERLLQAVQNLWRKVNSLETAQNNQGKVQNHHGQEIEAIKRELHSLKSQVHGLKVSKGRALAAKRRLEGELSEISAKLQ